jgi:hypothetical protein
MSWLAAVTCPAVICVGVGICTALLAATPTPPPPPPPSPHPQPNPNSDLSPYPVTRTRAWRCVFLVMLAAGACRGCINSVVMFVLVNKHGMTPSSLAAFSAGVILAAIFGNAVIFPRSYDAIGPRAMLSVFCVVTAVSFGSAYASEDYPVL